MITDEIRDLVSRGVGTNNIYFVRERGFSRFAAETQTIFRMVGVTDLVLWDETGKSFDQLAPKEVKLLVAGDGRATKENVRDALSKFVGPLEYKTDDESDSVAVGIAWLLKNEYEVKKRE